VYRTDDVKCIYKELERVFYKFPKHHTKNFLEYFNAKVGSKEIFKPIAGNESLYEIRNDNGIGVVNFKKKKKSKAIPVTGRGGLHGFGMLEITHCLHNQLTDGDEVVGLTHRSRSTPRNIFLSLVPILVIG
jgi:hypothetical protein